MHMHNEHYVCHAFEVSLDISVFQAHLLPRAWSY